MRTLNLMGSERLTTRPRWTIDLQGERIIVDLFEKVYSDREVMALLDDYKRAWETRHAKTRLFRTVIGRILNGR